MANQWVRLWLDMPNDPKWRTIARIAKQSIGNVIAVYVHMMTNAANARERGRTEGYTDEDTATALDLETGAVTAIREAMQGRVLDGDYLRGWDKRQPLREDDSAAERARKWREKKRQEKADADARTQPNATERKQTTDKDKDKDKDKEEKTNTKPARTAPEVLPKLIAEGVDEQTARDWLAHRRTKKASASASVIDDRVRECAKAGVPLVDGLKVEMSRGWQGFKAEWLADAGPPSRGRMQQYQSQQDKTREWAQRITGTNPNDYATDADIIDITPACPRIG